MIIDIRNPTPESLKLLPCRVIDANGLDWPDVV